MARVLSERKSKKDIMGEENIHNTVAKLAYQRFLDRDAAHGNDQEDWFEAEKEVKKQPASKNKKALHRTKKIPVE